jgi:hypothetical protein
VRINRLLHKSWEQKPDFRANLHEKSELHAEFKYEAADCGLLSADLAAGIRRVKGVKKLGVRLGNWLTAEQGQALLASA